MKAVIAIDMPDDVDLDKWYAVTVVVDRLIATEEELKQGIPLDESKVFKFVPLRPLPQRRTQPKYEDSISLGFRNGWNACLDEILGETE